MSNAELLEQFVKSFHKLDDLLAFEAVPPALDGGRDDSPWAMQKWKPAAIITDRAALTHLYRAVPGPFPPLYEQLLLSYRWLDVDLDGILRLLANPPGPGLQAIQENITADPSFVKVLFPLGLVPFGKVSGGLYDPLCFDTNRRHGDGDCPIVRVEHEAVLCDLQVREWWEVSPSFRSIMEAAASKAAQVSEP